MHYFKWQSDDKLFLLEKFVGKFNLDFLNLSEEYLLDYDKASNQLNLITDLGEASFLDLTDDEARGIAISFLRSIPKNLELKFALITGDSSRSDLNLIQSYAEPLLDSSDITYANFVKIQSAFDWFKMDCSLRTQIETEVRNWSMNRI